jgi:hypothetical protein
MVDEKEADTDFVRALLRKKIVSSVRRKGKLAVARFSVNKTTLKEAIDKEALA